MAMSQSGDVVLLKMTTSTRKANGAKGMRLTTCGSFTPFVNAAGEKFMEIICIKAAEGAKVKLNIPVEKKKVSPTFQFH